jgi:hypothetical protein
MAPDQWSGWATTGDGTLILSVADSRHQVHNPVISTQIARYWPAYSLPNWEVAWHLVQSNCRKPGFCHSVEDGKDPRAHNHVDRGRQPNLCLIGPASTLKALLQPIFFLGACWIAQLNPMVLGIITGLMYFIRPLAIIAVQQQRASILYKGWLEVLLSQIA